MIVITELGKYQLLYRKGSIDEFIFGEIMQARQYDFYKKYIPNPKTVIDIGAHIGIFSLKMLDEHPGCKVWSWEIAPANFDLLHINIKSNKLESRCKVYEYGVGDNAHSRIVMMSDTNTGANIIKEFMVDGIAGNGQMVKVSTMDFESVLNITGKKQVDVIKCDVERAELEIFTHVPRSTLRRSKVYMMEVHGRPNNAEDAFAYGNLGERFKTAGFSMFRGGSVVCMVRDDVDKAYQKTHPEEFVEQKVEGKDGN